MTIKEALQLFLVAAAATFGFLAFWFEESGSDNQRAVLDFAKLSALLSIAVGLL